LSYKKRLPRHFYTSKNFRAFYLKEAVHPIKIAVPKKIFRTAVLRNKVKRRIKESLRVNGLAPCSGGFLFLIYESFLDLDYQEASIELIKAVKSHNQQQVTNNEH
jgi:ribonuclease P protein component